MFLDYSSVLAKLQLIYVKAVSASGIGNVGMELKRNCVCVFVLWGMK